MTKRRMPAPHVALFLLHRERCNFMDASGKFLQNFPVLHRHHPHCPSSFAFDCIVAQVVPEDNAALFLNFV